MRGKLNILLIVVAVALFILSQCVFIVREGEVAIKTRVSQIVANDISPGIHFKWPLFEGKVIFDARLQTLDAEPENVLTQEKKELIVDYFVEWRIADTREYWVSTRGDRLVAENIIAQIVTDDLRAEFAKRTVNEVVSKDRSEIMDEITKSLSYEVKNQGMEVVDVRVKRVEFSDEIKDNVFRRMRAERLRVSNSLRALGREKERTIKAITDRQVQIILADANRDADIIRGQGIASATKIYAEAFTKDESFYRFQKSLEAYQQAFDGNESTFITSPDSEFFKYFRDKK
ncbi:MAG: protease modulator HflC [Gammaproteobacteria bacterium]|nr:MAG: protease modulator HflC [Gammaproteobacteria bacterium]